MMELNEAARALDGDNKDTEAGTRGPTVRGLDTGWSWVVVAASFGGFVSVCGTMLGVGVIHSTLLERYGASVALTSWAGSLHSAISSLAAPLASLLIDKFSCRVAMVICGVWYIIGYLATAFAPNIWMAIFTCGIVAGMAGTFGYTACSVVVGFYFDKKRNFAMGIAYSGCGFGLLIYPPIIQFAREFYGTSGFFIILAAMAANVVTFGMVFFPNQLELKAKRDKHTDGGVSRLGLGVYKSVLTNKPLLLICLSMTMYGNGVFSLLVHSTSFSEESGFSQREASLFLSIMGGVNVAGRLLTGIIATASFVDDLYVYVGASLILSLETFLFPLFAKYFVGQVLHAIIWGLFYGSCMVILPSISIRFVGLKYMSAAMGLLLFYSGIGCLLGPVLGGVIYDTVQSYVPAIMFSAICLLVSGLLGLVTKCFCPVGNQTLTTNVKDDFDLQSTAIRDGEDAPLNTIRGQ